LSDARLALASALHLPTFAVEGMVLLKRLTLILRDGVIEHVFYSVFPPDKNAEQVLAWLAQHRLARLDTQAEVADQPARQNMPETEIRLATPSDAPFLAAVLYQAFAEYALLYTPQAFAATTPPSEQIARRMSEGPIWVAVRDGTIIGTVAAPPRGKELYVRSMAVLPDARGHRIGALLLTALENFAGTHGYERLCLSTTPFLPRAIRLYERWGFRRSSAGPRDLFGTALFTLVKDLRQ
jgi:GNAT superfamily N-acetyltransferase